MCLCVPARYVHVPPRREERVNSTGVGGIDSTDPVLMLGIKLNFTGTEASDLQSQRIY